MPLVAGGAVDQPLRLALDVIELRAYAAVKDALKQSDNENYVVPDSPMVAWVYKVEAELLRRRRAESAAMKSERG